MKDFHIPLTNTGYFSPLFTDYLLDNKELKNFYSYTPDISGLAEKINSYTFSGKRSLLNKVLRQQYKSLESTAEVSRNIELLLEDNTFCVTTGHQLNIFTGPLYFIYKIVTAINLVKKLNKEFPDKNFVPVYWMASEDHDFEEINNFILFGKKYVWESDQKGAVGKFTLESMKPLLESLPEKIPLFEEAYSQSANLSEATRLFMQELFGAYGLVVVDADNVELKSLFLPVILKELEEQSSFSLITTAKNNLEELGYHPQVNPREINLFYMQEGLRERIIKTNNNFLINNTTITFSREEILSLAKQHPEYFSPNVVLRPLYQELLLPNIAYVGGPAEISYWLELKSLFSNHNVQFPVLFPRNFILFINKIVIKKLEKLQVDPLLLFLEESKLKEVLLQKKSAVQYDLSESKVELESNFERIRSKAKAIDPTLEAYVLSELQKGIRIIEDIEKKLKKAEEKKNSDFIQQVFNIKNKLFPGNGLQERSENFLNFFINDPHFIQKIIDHTDPMKLDFNILIDE